MADLTKRTLGRTGAVVTTLGYGAMELRGGDRGRDISEEDAGRLLNEVLDSGITFIDTSIDYGIAEERIGRHISHRRDEYFLASKCGCLVGPPPADAQPNQRGGFPHLFTKENITAGIEQSLRRLNTDHLDLVQLHASPSMQELEENGSLEAMQVLQAQGKVRFLGMSGTIPNLASHIASGVFDAFQIPYSSVQREHEDLITEASKAGAGIIIRGGAARGAPSNDERNRERGAESLSVWEKAELGDLLDGMSNMEFVMRFTETHPSMTTNIVGTINPNHLKQNLASVSKGPLPKDLYEEAKRRLAAAGTAPES
jgi:aryl-alcohol dehydrogenase-like predicted oxidoreductase